jgi:hypothetical protein
MKLSSEDIRLIVHELREKSYVETEMELKDGYHRFFQEYPVLFNKSIDQTFDLVYLDRMLEMMDKLNSKLVSLDDADKDIYDELRNDFVTPVIIDKK